MRVHARLVCPEGEHLSGDEDTSECLVESARAHRFLSGAVDRCLASGVAADRVAEALVRMAEALTSEVGEDTGTYRALSPDTRGVDQEPLGKECPCGWVYEREHVFCSRCGAELRDGVVPKSIPGRLQFEKRVGKGGSGVVYQAIDMSLGRRVAVKTLPALRTDDIVRLRREAQALAAVSHRHLATVYGFEVYRGTPLIVMEYVDGGTLAERIPLPLDVAVEVMLEITAAVECLHRAGIVHRDIKPRNIGFTSHGELKLLDFGLARLEDEMTMSGVAGHVIVGTPAYLSPEALTRQPACPAFDLWALCIVFYEILTGSRPFAGLSREGTIQNILDSKLRPIDDLLPGCPRKLRRFVDSGLNSKQARRPQSAKELRASLEGLRVS